MTARVPEHGTYARYSAHPGCRCADCREAKRRYVAERRADGREPDLRVPPPAWNDRARGNRVGLRRVRLVNVTHGTTTAYRRGCRCWDCTDVSSAAWRARYQRRKSA